MEPMTTAITTAAGRAAGTAATKALLQRNGRVRLGGREERRIVYAHFQVCAIRLHNSLDDLARTAFLPFSGKAKLNDRVLHELREIQEAMAELTMVGNARPVVLGAGLLVASTSMDIRRRPSHKRNAGIGKAHDDALAAFIAACREDLWYLPQWWQIWRPAWWSARWSSYRTRVAEKKEIKAKRKARIKAAKQLG